MLNVFIDRGTTVSGTYYLNGDVNTDGSWRIRSDGTDVLIEYRAAGVWVTKFKVTA